MTSPLTAGTEYAVAVAGFDQANNVGPLSTPLACATPIRFPRVEGRAGCATAPRGSPWSLLVVLGAGLGCAAGRRRGCGRR
jgi:hypothetical protein